MLLELVLQQHGTGLLYSSRSDNWSNYKDFDVDIKAGETVLLEPSYPIVLAENGDTLAVGTGNISGLAATHVNFMITGDKEADKCIQQIITLKKCHKTFKRF